MTVTEGQPSSSILDTGAFTTFISQGKLNEAKLLLRTNLVQDKPGVFKSIVALYTRDTPLDNNAIYWDTVETCFGGRDIDDCADRTPSCVDSNHTPSYSLDKEARAQVCRIVTCLAYNSPDVPYCPLLFPTTALFREHMGEEESFEVVSLLVSPPAGITYCTQSKRSWDISCLSLKPLAAKFIKKHLVSIEKECGGVEAVESCLAGWPWWIFECLGPAYLARILPSYLMEGEKVLYRVALALVKAFSRELSRSGSNLKTNVKTNKLSQEMPRFCRELKLPVNDLLRSAFKIPRFSKAEIRKVHVALEMEIKAGTMKLDQTRRRSNEEHLTGQQAQDILAVSDTLSYKQLIKLWHCIPERITMINPTKVFSTNDHGTSLKTFYHKCENYEPTILVIKSTKGEVFGAYCSTAWSARNECDEKGLRQRYFGTGESFLFRMRSGNQGGEEEQVDKFPWVGEGKEMVGKGERAEQLYMSGDQSMITIGGGDGTGLYVDANLELGRTEACRTFGNPPLCSTPDFTVAVMEVFGFNNIEW